MKKTSRVHFDTLTTNQMDNLKNFQDLHTPPEQTMLRLSPTEQLAFPYGGETSECHLEITSSARTRVTYKIQTTSPEKFRVRPRCGILMPGETVSISIFLKPEHKLADGNKDKFLIMSLALPPDYEVALQQLADLWKTKTPLDSDVEQHRLCCHYKAASAPIGSGSGACTGNSAEPGQTAAASSFADERNYLDMILTRHQKKFEKQMRRQHMLTYLTLLFVIMIAIAVGYLLKLKIYPENCYVKSSNQ